MAVSERKKCVDVSLRPGTQIRNDLVGGLIHSLGNGGAGGAQLLELAARTFLWKYHILDPAACFLPCVLETKRTDIHRIIRKHTAGEHIPVPTDPESTTACHAGGDPALLLQLCGLVIQAFLNEGDTLIFLLGIQR